MNVIGYNTFHIVLNIGFASYSARQFKNLFRVIKETIPAVFQQIF
jgi:hypothetical protein